MPSELIADKALILRNFSAKESDSVIHCLTQNHGKLHLYAKHARNSKRRFGGGLDPLTLGEMEFRAGKDTQRGASSIMFLESFKTLDSAHHYLNPFVLYQAANLWIECIDYLSTEGDTQSGLFDIAKKTLAEFTVLDTREDFEWELAKAVKSLLVQSGFLPDDHVVETFQHALQLVEEVSQKALKAKW